MYEKFFNLRTKPFELVPNPDFLYMSRSHKKALAYLEYGIKEKSGFILMTGEVGAGKTTIIKNLIKGAKGKVTLSKVFNTRVSSDQLISMINEDFGLSVEGKGKTVLLRELNEFLIEQYANKYQPILIIDESQNLTPELLEEVRLISNLETDTSKLLQIILVGQPELKKTLARPELRQLRQRISISCHLQPLAREETQEYISHRLEVAGNRDAVEFSEEVLDLIHSFSEGIPRLINIICDFLMVSAYSDETKEFTPELVREVAAELDMDGQQVGAQEHQVVDEVLMGRLKKLEEEVLMLRAERDEREDISERFCSLEKLLIAYIGRHQTFLARQEGILQQIERSRNGKGRDEARRVLLEALLSERIMLSYVEEH